MSKVRWAVWGSCGIAKRRTIPEGILAAENAELVAVYDLHADANKELAQRLGVKAVGSPAKLLSSGAQAIYIATPAHLHCRQVVTCAKAGKSVLCEKPLGMTVNQAQTMLSTCRDAGVHLGTAFMMRFVAQHQAALKMVREGLFGKMAYARAQLSCWYPPMPNAWRQVRAQAGGGSLMDMGGHCIDLLEMFLGPVVKLHCFTNNIVHEYETEDSAVATLQFANGAIATVDAFFCVPDAGSKNVLELYGSKGSILAKGTIGQGQAGEMTAFIERSGEGYEAQQTRPIGQGEPINPTPVNAYRAEIEEFSQAILEKRPSAIDGELGLRSQMVLSACYRSAKTGRAVGV